MTSDQTITYEAFGESAQALHDVCQCTLTQLKDRVSAGFPCHSVLGYARLLNQKGHVLAIVPRGSLLEDQGRHRSEVLSDGSGV